MEHDKLRQFTLQKMTVDDIPAVDAMRRASWLATYPNEEFDISREWIEARFEAGRDPERIAKRQKAYQEFGENGWLARDDKDEIIGATTPFCDENGVQHVGSLYVDRQWHGKGVGGALMQKVIEWADPKRPIELGVVAYNERAKAFYQKWGFVEIPNSQELFADKMPEIKMIRKGDEQ